VKRRVVVPVILLVSLLAHPLPAVASSSPGPVGGAPASPAGARVSSPVRPEPAGILETAVRREAARLASEPPVRRAGGLSGFQQQPAQVHRGWIGRHPVWFGTIVGTVAGTAAAAAVWGGEGAAVGFYAGAALGATTGAIVAAAR